MHYSVKEEGCYDVFKAGDVIEDGDETGVIIGPSWHPDPEYIRPWPNGQWKVRWVLAVPEGGEMPKEDLSSWAKAQDAREIRRRYLEG